MLRGQAEARLDGAVLSTADTICSKGVIRRWCSLANGKLYDMAPTWRPSYINGRTRHAGNRRKFARHWRRLACRDHVLFWAAIQLGMTPGSRRRIPRAWRPAKHALCSAAQAFTKLGDGKDLDTGPRLLCGPHIAKKRRIV
jgi:hypothetical protein